MRPSVRIAVAVAALGLGAAALAFATSNLNLSKSNVNRVGGAIVMSGTATMSGPRETQTAIQVPEAGDFLLTQACVGPVNGGIRIEARNAGPLLHVGDPLCVTLQPGISVKPGTALTCSTTSFAAAGGDYFCTLSGLYAR